VTEHINSLETIKAEVIEVENYEAAEVIAKSISLIKSAYIANHNMAKEISSMKNNLRVHLACNAMQGMLAGRQYSFNTIPEYAFGMADAMIKATKE
jgi:hypothetical protein